MTDITKYVYSEESALTLTTEGWEAANKVASVITGKNDAQQWAQLFSISERKLKGDEEQILFFLAIARKIYNGEITPMEEVDVDI